LLTSALVVLGPALDIVEQPVNEPIPPDWCRKRRWDEFLLGLTDSELFAAETRGLRELLSMPRFPPALSGLVNDVQRITQLPALSEPSWELPSASWRGVSARKRAQIAALLPVLAPFATLAERVVDVGAGTGHLSRLVAELFRRETLALDRDPQRVRAASERAEQRAREVGALSLSCVVADACATRPELRATDLAVGLHACGALGDRLVLAAAEARCDLALISCCLQKLPGEMRLPLSQTARGFSLPRAALGLTNLSIRADGVESSLAENLRARATRLALRRLLSARGVVTAAGEEMRGVNRRRAHAGLPELAARVCSARSLPPPTADELRDHERTARQDHARIRRLSLPRNLLARLVELAIVLDRGAVLEEQGFAVRVLRLFDRRLTPRNLALLASTDPARLPPSHALVTDA
jgi:SAM-dependent methyltransferase